MRDVGEYDSISSRTTDTDEGKGAEGGGGGLLSRIFGGRRDSAADQVNTGDPAAAVEESTQVVEDAKGNRQGCKQTSNLVN